MSKHDNFLIGLFKFSLPTLFTLIVGIVAIPILSRVYPTVEYGKINFFYTIGNFLYMISLLGLDFAYIRFFYEPQDVIDKNQILKFTLCLGFLFSSILFILAYVFFSDKILIFLFDEKKSAAFLFLYIYVIGQIIFRMVTVTSRMSQNARFYCLEQVLMTLSTRILFVIVAVFSVYYLPSIAFISISSLLIGYCFYITHYRRYANFKDTSFPNKITLLCLLKYAIPLIPSSLLMWFNNSVAKIILTSSGDFNALGIYAMASSIAVAFAALPGAFGVYWSPFIYKNYNTEQDMIKNVHDYVLFFCILLCIITIAFQDVIFLILGVNYRSSQDYFMMLMFVPLATLICETTSYGVNIAQKTYISFYLSFMACLINFFICWMLFPVYGVIGVALGGSISSVFQLISRSYFGQKYYRSINNYFKSLFFFMVIFALCVFNFYLTDNLLVRFFICISTFILAIISYRAETIMFIHKLSSVLKNHLGRNF